MAFSVTVKSKKSQCKLNLVKILENCKLHFGSYNDFYILEEGEMNDDTMILYNPEKIGRGIFLNFKEIGNGELTLGCSLPTTSAEIEDFFNIMHEIKSQCENIEIYFEDEKQDEDKFFDLTNTILNVSLDSLKENCSKGLKLIQTLARFPYTFSDKQLNSFKNATDLKEYEDLLHNVQNRDSYYAKPTLRQFPGNDGILACYVFTSNCESIFPIKGDVFLNFDEIEISDSYINFFLREETRLIDGIYKYDDFIQYVLNKGAEYFDANHIIIKMSKNEVIEMLEFLQKI